MKYGKGAGSRMATSLEKVGQANGIQFNNERRVHNTIKSHRLVRLADAQDKGNEMIEQLFHGYFEEGKNIADVDVLVELAQKVMASIFWIYQASTALDDWMWSGFDFFLCLTYTSYTLINTLIVGSDLSWLVCCCVVLCSFQMYAGVFSGCVFLFLPPCV